MSNFFFKEENILGNGITQASYAMGPGCNCKRRLTGQSVVFGEDPCCEYLWKPTRILVREF